MLKCSPLLAAALVGAACSTFSIAAHAEETPFKLTATSHRMSESGQGFDMNLRHNGDWGAAWIGYFDESGLHARQFRGGWERAFGETVRVTPSLQVAEGGFAGGSINFETGDSWFIGAGYGRTNLRPYYNLNFDPNDAWMVSGGYRAPNGQNYSIGIVQDDRENPDQRHIHAIYRTPLPNGDRLTLDVLFKRGSVNGEMIQRTGLTVTYDWPRYFVRLAFDPNTNFTTDDVVRLSLGMRF